MELTVVHCDCRTKDTNRLRGKSVGVFGVTADKMLQKTLQFIRLVKLSAL
jgi:hypothetical protein